MRINKQQILAICKKLDQKLTKYRFLAAGGLNECYLVTTPRARYVVKIENNKGYSEREHKNLLLATEKLAPKVYLFDKSGKIIPKTYMVQEFLKGKHPPIQLSNDFIIKMAKWFKQLHSIKSSQIEPNERKRIYSLGHWANQSCNKLKKIQMPINQDLRKQIEDRFQTTLVLCKENNDLFRSRKTFPLVHGDPWRENVFIEKKGIRLIDWEFAGFVLGERDLIIFIRAYNLSNQQKALFLKTYGYPQTTIARKKINVVAQLLTCSDLLWLLERINSIEKGKVGKRQQQRTKREAIKKIRKILSKSK
ncbi:phosphotransferase [Candidatus Woesearchaeota archaeon]|nr:phosphotransferase [Candidatus Woesearchaeota archaeon]